MTQEERETGGFKSLGEFCIAVRKECLGEAHNGQLDGLKKTALAEGTDSIGGFLVPEKFADGIRYAALENSIVRGNGAIVVPMTTDTLNINMLVDGDRSSSIFGGVTMTWLAEVADQFATTVAPKFEKAKLTAREGVASCFISNSLENDVMGFGAYLETAFGKALAFYEDEKFIWGTGSGQPQGIVYGPGTLSIARAVGYGAVTAKDFANMVARFLPGSLSSGVWLINQSVLAALANDATSGANAMGAIDLADMLAFGMPIIVTEKCAASGSVGDIILADFANGYVIGDRELYIAASKDATYSSNSYGWFQNQTCWKIVIRVDGQTLLPAAITPNKGGSTLSHFVTLTTVS